MSNKYDLKMLKRGMIEFKNIMNAFQYLMDVGAIDELDLYNEFNSKDEAGNPQDFTVHIENDLIEMYFMYSGLRVTADELIFIVEDDEDKEYEIFRVKNPNEINNEESFFQASTLSDLTDVEGHEWFTTIMDSYASVMDFMESDDV